MFRVTAAAIVLALSASPLSPLVCATGCDNIDPAAVSGEAIHHEAISGAALVAGDECADRVLDTWAFVREDTKRPESYAAARAILHGSRSSSSRDAAHFVVDHSVARAVTSPHLSLVLRV